MPSRCFIFHCYVDVSENSGTPQSSIFIGCSITNHPFWVTLIVGNTHVSLPECSQNRTMIESHPFIFWGKGRPMILRCSPTINMDSTTFDLRLPRCEWNKWPKNIIPNDCSITLPETNIFAPEKWWLEYDRSLLGPGLFSELLLLVSGSVMVMNPIVESQKNTLNTSTGDAKRDVHSVHLIFLGWRIQSPPKYQI